MEKIDYAILELEHEYLEYVERNYDRRRKLMPITNKYDIKALIFNLFTYPKYRKKLSFDDFSSILDVFFDRISKQEILNYKNGKED